MNILLTCDDIRKILPHRYPFLLLDCVTHIDPGIKGIGIKNVTVNEPFFQGHFPGESIMPGVLIAEALAQLTAVVYCSKILKEKGINDIKDIKNIESDEIARHVGYLVGVNIKFKKPVVPGNQLVLEAALVKSLGILTYVNVTASVNNTIVSEGKIIVSERE
ncbi:MAG: 3-hydroxyacyl-ACP dehydratase FabZ [Spirochaetales bacterium]|nr:3-hydroxyacyl-ACP dehydratase FabZ [Spirochaetales bacterium]